MYRMCLGNNPGLQCIALWVFPCLRVMPYEPSLALKDARACTRLFGWPPWLGVCCKTPWLAG